jgi:superfamily II DNA helicase RecQ
VAFRRAHLAPAAARLDTLEDVEVPIEEKPEATTLAKPRKAAKGKAFAGAATSAPLVDAADRRLVEALKAWRLKTANHEGVPAFRVMSDKTLRAIATARPRTQVELYGLPGIGARFVERHGRDLLEALEKAEDE